MKGSSRQIDALTVGLFNLLSALRTLAFSIKPSVHVPYSLKNSSHDRFSLSCFSWKKKWMRCNVRLKRFEPYFIFQMGLLSRVSFKLCCASRNLASLVQHGRSIRCVLLQVHQRIQLAWSLKFCIVFALQHFARSVLQLEGPECS